MLKISEHGLIGNSRAAALVSNRGEIDWCCLPGFDSPSFFSSILGNALNGVFSITPIQKFKSAQKYIDDTNVLETTFRTQTGEAKLLDCFTVTSEAEKKNRFWPDDEILRMVEGHSGEVFLRMRYRPCEDYGEEGIRLRKQGNWGVRCESGKRLLLLQSSHLTEDPRTVLTVIRFEDGEEAVAEFRIRPGQKVFFSMIYADEAPAIFPPLGESAIERLNLTISYWRKWVAQCKYQGPYEKEVHRSALVLKLLTYAPSGAVVAAPTTSLPEVIGGARNWDYRYCWLRDASFTVNALVGLGFLDEAKAFVGWLIHTTRLTRPRLQVLYSVFGRPEIREREITWLNGYSHSRPVRIGNAAYNQFQLDIYGEVLDAFYKIIPYLGKVDRETKRLLFDMADSVCELWTYPDEGIWEVRSGRRQHTHSKVLAWVALDRLEKICKRQQWAISKKYTDTCAALRESIETLGFNVQLGSYTQTFQSDNLDASVLVLPLVGFCEASSPRMAGTIHAIRNKLSKNKLLYRYRGIDDGIKDTSAEGAFGICNFWMAECLFRSGKIEEGKYWLDSILSHFSETGLCSEEINPDTGELLGNFPQAFTHIGFINAVVQLSAVEAGKEEYRMTFHWPNALLWGFLSTLLLSSLLSAGQSLGLTRMDIPYMLGTVFSKDRDRAKWIGFLFHLCNGMFFALIYVDALISSGHMTWWFGGILGLIQAFFLLTIGMSVLPAIHPRMASEEYGPDPTHQLEPPGFMALNYGRQTPIATLIAHFIYGAMIGLFYR